MCLAIAMKTRIGTQGRAGQHRKGFDNSEYMDTVCVVASCYQTGIGPVSSGSLCIASSMLSFLVQHLQRHRTSAKRTIHNKMHGSETMCVKDTIQPKEGRNCPVS